MPRTIENLKKHYADCFTTNDGMQVLKDLKAAYQMRESFVKGDPYETARREGERAVYLRIIFMSNLKKED
jgi:hypothetical protein